MTYKPKPLRNEDVPFDFTITVEKRTMGEHTLFMATSTLHKGLFAVGRDLAELLSHIPRSYSELHVWTMDSCI
jgi:hypothetical protein